MATRIGRYRHAGRPTQFDRLLEMSKIAWAPVLELLGREIRFADLAARPFVSSADELQWAEVVLRLETNGKINHRELHWLTPEQIVSIHDEMITYFGGEAGTRDKAVLAGALDRARSSLVGNLDPFPTVLHKAAVLLHQILVYHPFVDGQKRTGISVAFIFLGMNGYLLWSRNVVEEVHFAVQVAEAKIEVDEIATWLAARVAPRELLHDVLPENMLEFARQKTRPCSVCGRQVPIVSFEVACPKCRTKYRVIVNSGLIHTTKKGRRLALDIGLRMAGPG